MGPGPEGTRSERRGDVIALAVGGRNERQLHAPTTRRLSRTVKGAPWVEIRWISTGKNSCPRRLTATDDTTITKLDTCYAATGTGGSWVVLRVPSSALPREIQEAL